MLFWCLLIVSIIGLGYAGYKDLTTTEFPDWLPYSIIIAALGTRAVFAYLYMDWEIILSSIKIGGLLLAVGLLLYHFKQWGDGDGWLLGTLGFLYPGTAAMPQLTVSIMPFPLIMLLNFFIISFMYLVAYSVTFGLKNKKAVRKFFRELKKDMKSIEIITGVFTILSVGLGLYLYFNNLVPILFVAQLFLFPVFLLSLLVFMRYGRFVETDLFKKQISVRDLRVGDVPVGSKWKVMTEKELAKLKKKGGKIWIKEGVRFAPVFIITVLVTLFYGSLFGIFF